MERPSHKHFFIIEKILKAESYARSSARDSSVKPTAAKACAVGRGLGTDSPARVSSFVCWLEGAAKELN